MASLGQVALRLTFLKRSSHLYNLVSTETMCASLPTVRLALARHTLWRALIKKCCLIKEALSSTSSVVFYPGLPCSFSKSKRDYSSNLAKSLKSKSQPLRYIWISWEISLVMQNQAKVLSSILRLIQLRRKFSCRTRHGNSSITWRTSYSWSNYPQRDE